MLPLKNWPSLLIAASLLSACVTAGSERKPVKAAAAPRVSLVVYPKERQARLADEIERAAAVDLWPEIVTDYSRLRRAICAAEGWKQQACRDIRTADGAR